MATRTAVRRLGLGDFVRPAEETGGPRPRVEPVLACLVRQERGSSSSTPEWAPPTTRPRRTTGPGGERCARRCRRWGRAGRDHPGGQLPPALRPLRRQSAADGPAGPRAGQGAGRGACGHTFQVRVDFPGAVYEELNGEAEVWPGVRNVLTAGPHRGAPVAGRRAGRRDRDPRRARARLRLGVRLGPAGPPARAGRHGTAPPGVPALAGPARRVRPAARPLRPRLLGPEPSRPPGIARAANPA